MNVLIIGSGGREHALAWKIAQSPRVKKVFIAPGNVGTAAVGTNMAVDAFDFPGIIKAVSAKKIDLVVVGPEGPLAVGIADYLHGKMIPVFGPTMAAAAIESSKTFARKLMLDHGIPCARGESFSNYEDAIIYVRSLQHAPVIKSDGLAAGKGVTVAGTKAEALRAIEQAMVDGVFGKAGMRVVVEERLEGMEASVFAFTDGERVLSTEPACDYKRAYDSERGPNTGGMGSYSPPEFLDAALLKKIRGTIMEPAVKALAKEGRTYQGVLYASVIVSNGEAKVIEFNARLGDPETQVVLPRLKSDIMDAIEGVVSHRLKGVTLDWDPRPCVGVVLTSGGYPGAYRTGEPIKGLDLQMPGVHVFHAGTELKNGIVTAGGRVLTVAAIGANYAEARERAYEAASRIEFSGAHYRRDIALRPTLPAKPKPPPKPTAPPAMAEAATEPAPSPPPTAPK